MVAGSISPIRNAFGNILEISTLPMRKGLFDNILNVGVVDVYNYIVGYVYFGVLFASALPPYCSVAT